MESNFEPYEMGDEDLVLANLLVLGNWDAFF